MDENVLLKKSKVQERNIFIILAYALLLYVAVAGNFVYAKYLLEISSTGIVTVKNIIFSDNYNITDLIFLVFTIAALIVLFKIAILNKTVKITGKIIIWCFIAINVFWIFYGIREIIGYFIRVGEIVLHHITWTLFRHQYAIGIVNVILSIAFLKHINSRNRIIKALSNKWVILTLLLLGYIVFASTAIKDINNYYKSQTMSRFFATTFISANSDIFAIKFPILKLITIWMFGFSLVFFFAHNIGGMKTNKFIRLFFILNLILLFASIVSDIAAVSMNQNIEEGRYALGGFIFPDYYFLSVLCLFAAMYRKCCGKVEEEALMNKK